MFPRATPKQMRVARRPAHRYATLRRGAAASVAVNFLAAAVEMMKDVREAFERAFGPRLTEAEIERRAQEHEQEADARERFRAAADEFERWKQFWDEQRRRAEEAAQPPGSPAASRALPMRQEFRDRATVAERRHDGGFALFDIVPAASLTNPLGGFFDGDDSFDADDFDLVSELGYNAF